MAIHWIRIATMPVCVGLALCLYRWLALRSLTPEQRRDPECVRTRLGRCAVLGGVILGTSLILSDYLADLLVRMHR